MTFAAALTVPAAFRSASAIRTVEADGVSDHTRVAVPAALPEPEASLAAGASALTGREAVNLIEDLTSKMNRSPQKRLEQIVEFDEKHAAAILRQWMRTEA